VTDLNAFSNFQKTRMIAPLRPFPQPPDADSSPRPPALPPSRPPPSAASQRLPKPDYIANVEFARLTDAEMFAATPPTNDAEFDPRLLNSRAGQGMPAYLLRLCETKLLTPEQETQLFRRMNFAKYRAHQLQEQAGLPQPPASRTVEELARRALADRNHLVQANLRLVVSIAKKFANPRDSFDDLLSEGIASLMRAVDKFDYARGFRFSTYATQAVRRTLYRLVTQRRLDRSRFVTEKEVAMKEHPQDDTSGTMSETRWNELQASLQKLLGQLEPRERLILCHRFGLDQQQQVDTLQSLARRLGICKERVRQIEQRAITKLRLMADEAQLSPLNDS
jgi:RNA polymerase primary sigma factor